MLNKLILTILFSLVFSNNIDCNELFFKSNENSLRNNFIYIKAYLDNSYKDSLNMFIQKNKRIKLELNNRVVLLDSNKTMNYNPESKQLFIDRPDPLLSNWLQIKNNYQLLNYFLENESFDRNSFLFYNKDCSKIDSLFISFNQTELKLYQLSIDSINIKNPDHFFSLNVDEEKIFKYDFR